MSLINDALKRAKEAQQKAPVSADAPQLKPAEPTQPLKKQKNGLLLPIIMMLIVAGGIVAILQARKNSAPTANTASTPVPPQPAAPVAVAPAPTVDVPVAPVQRSAGLATPSAATPQPEVAVTSNKSQPVKPSAPAPTVVAPAAQPPTPAPLKLQAIFFSPTRPSAIISGKTVFVGDNIRSFQVRKIEPETVTLVGAMQTNVLSLAQ